MHMQSNNDEKKYRFFYPFTGEAPLKRNARLSTDKITVNGLDKPKHVNVILKFVRQEKKIDL